MIIMEQKTGENLHLTSTITSHPFLPFSFPSFTYFIFKSYFKVWCNHKIRNVLQIQETLDFLRHLGINC